MKFKGDGVGTTAPPSAASSMRRSAASDAAPSARLASGSRVAGSGSSVASGGRTATHGGSQVLAMSPADLRSPSSVGGLGGSGMKRKTEVRLGGLRGGRDVTIEDILGGYAAGRELRAVELWANPRGGDVDTVVPFQRSGHRA